MHENKKKTISQQPSLSDVLIMQDILQHDGREASVCLSSSQPRLVLIRLSTLGDGRLSWPNITVLANNRAKL